MTTRPFLPLFLALSFLVACRSDGAGARSPASPAPTGPAASTAEKIGVFAPLGADAYRFWHQAHSGPLLVSEILPQGTPVQEGDVLVRLDSRAIDDEVHQAELELRSTRVGHRATLERNRLDEEAARSAVERARAALVRAQRSLAGWKEQELVFARRTDEISKSYEEANVEDQTDELDQLTKMYQADELVDATEDIVIKRSRRALALTGLQNQLARDRARYREGLELALQTEQREEEVRAQSEALARLVAQQEIEARGRQDAAVRSADALAQQEQKLERLEHDRETFVVRAWRAGVFLHGGPREYLPGKTPARYQRGDALPARVEAFTIADPEPSAVAFEVSDGELALFGDGTRLEARPMGVEGSAVAGTVSVEPYARTLATNERTLEARVQLEHPVAGARYGMRARLVPGEAGAVE